MILHPPGLIYNLHHHQAVVKPLIKGIPILFLIIFRKRLKLIEQPLLAVCQMIALGLAPIFLEGKLRQNIGCAITVEKALISLNADAKRRSAVLGGNAHGLKIRILHHKDSGCIHAALHIGAVTHL